MANSHEINFSEEPQQVKSPAGTPDSIDTAAVWVQPVWADHQDSSEPNKGGAEPNEDSAEPNEGGAESNEDSAEPNEGGAESNEDSAEAPPAATDFATNSQSIFLNIEGEKA